MDVKFLKVVSEPFVVLLQKSQLKSSGSPKIARKKREEARSKEGKAVREMRFSFVPGLLLGVLIAMFVLSKLQLL
jgi:hypothetical protein